LLCLSDEPGRLSTREELRSRLWPNGTFVDFDHSLNVAVNRLRERLGDSADHPHYVETVPGIGYRFIGSIEQIRISPAAPLPADVSASVQSLAIRERRFRAASVLTICVLSLLAFVWLIWHGVSNHFGSGAEPSIESLAVLPLTNLARSDGNDYFADGVTEELITDLAKLASFRVISRTSVMRYKNTNRSLAEIGRELDVNALVEGTVRRFGDRVRVTVQLIGLSPEHHVWAEAYEGDIHDVLNLQCDVAKDIASKIQTKLAFDKLGKSSAKKRLDPETYEDYLRGRYFLARRNANAMNKALAYFQQALQRDPQYAQAYAGLAVAYDLLGMYELRPPENSFSQVKQFATKALQFDETLSEAYTARAAAASFWEFDWPAAERDFERAIALDPSSAFAHHWYGEHFINVGKAERAVSELKRARELDPLSLPINSTLGRVYRDAQRFNEAVEQCKKTIELDPNFSMGHWCLGQAYLGERQYSSAISELERANALGTTPLILCDLGYAYAGAGEDVQARAFLNALQQKAQSAYVPPYLIAAIYGALGQKNEAFRYLQRAYTERDSHITYLALDPEMDPLRSDPRFPEVLRRLKIPK
jgi:TolB-like protein/Tfp pilus assembly protein PilF